MRSLSIAPALRPPGAAWSRAALLRVLERVEAGESSRIKPAKATGHLHHWQSNDRIMHALRQLHGQVLASFGPDQTEDERSQMLEVGLARWFYLPDQLTSAVRTAELDRLTDLVFSAAADLQRSPLREEEAASEYAVLLRLLRRGSPGAELSKLGRVFLDLPAPHGLRWLLHLEVAQAAGSTDPTLLSRELAKSLGARQRWRVDWGDDSHAVISRLVEFGLISEEDNDIAAYSDLSVLPHGLKLLQEVAEPDGTPLGVLASTLCDDQFLSAVESAGRSDAVGSSLAAEATARQARLVAHEIRNTLVPLQSTLQSLFQEVVSGTPEDAIRQRRPGIDRSVNRLFDFVQDLVLTAELGAAPPEPFDPAPAIRDALAAMDPVNPIALTHSFPSVLPPLLGVRGRFVTALVNLLRNAVQHGGSALKRVQVQASSVGAGRMLLLTIEDDGLGVPEPLREAVFTSGISLSAGGTGLGLALVREVFERELRGSVRCEASPLGGARFVIEVPVAGAQPREGASS